MQALLTTLILIYLTLMILFKLISSFKSSKIFTLILLVCRYIELRSFRPTNKQCIKLQRLSCYCIFLISFNNVCRYLLTVLSTQQLIQPLGYFNFFGTSAIKSEIIFLCNRRIEAKYLRQKVSCDVSIQLRKILHHSYCIS